MEEGKMNKRAAIGRVNSFSSNLSAITFELEDYCPTDKTTKSIVAASLSSSSMPFPKELKRRLSSERFMADKDGSRREMTPLVKPTRRGSKVMMLEAEFSDVVESASTSNEDWMKPIRWAPDMNRSTDLGTFGDMRSCLKYNLNFKQMESLMNQQSSTNPMNRGIDDDTDDDLSSITASQSNNMESTSTTSAEKTVMAI